MFRDKLKLAIDIFYHDDINLANVAGISFRNWEDTGPIKVFKTTSTIESKYIPGQFYKRELPCILKLISDCIGWDELKNNYDTILVDGLYDLWDNKIGLGHHLLNVLKEEHGIDNIEVIGIAKSKVRDSDKICQFSYRGLNTTNPLCINGSNKEKDYVKLINSMYGSARIPDLIKLVDQLSRK